MKNTLNLMIFSILLFSAVNIYSQNTSEPQSSDSKDAVNKENEVTNTPDDKIKDNKVKIEENTVESPVNQLPADGSTNSEGTVNPEQNNTPEYVKQWYIELQQARRNNDVLRVNELQKRINDYYGVKPAEPSQELQYEYPAKNN